MSLVAQAKERNAILEMARMGIPCIGPGFPVFFFLDHFSSNLHIVFS